MSGSGGVSVRAGPSAKPYGRRKATRQAQRRAMRRAQLAAREVEHTEPDGALVCGACGRLRWSDRGQGAPHRREAAGPEHEHEPCAHCGETLWLDLGRPSTALALRAAEDEHVDARGRFALKLIATVLMGIPFGWFVVLITGAGAMTQALAGALGGVLGALIAVRSHRSVEVADGPALPARWAMALPPKGVTEQRVTGAVTLRDDVLRAPLTGRPCVAWEVGARPDDDADDPPETWWLVEQRVASLEVDGVSLEPARTHLELPRVRLGTLDETELDDSARAFLRQRGIGSDGGSVHLFESIVEPEARVSAEIGPDGSVLRIVPESQPALPGA